jgi:coenzyme PQQ precursor peptide PqqA
VCAGRFGVHVFESLRTAIRRIHVRRLQNRLSQSILDILVIEKDLGRTKMAWTTPTLVEICIGLEINGYLPAEF